MYKSARRGKEVSILRWEAVDEQKSIIFMQLVNYALKLWTELLANFGAVGGDRPPPGINNNAEIAPYPKVSQRSIEGR